MMVHFQLLQIWTGTKHGGFWGTTFLQWFSKKDYGLGLNSPVKCRIRTNSRARKKIHRSCIELCGCCILCHSLFGTVRSCIFVFRGSLLAFSGEWRQRALFLSSCSLVAVDAVHVGRGLQRIIRTLLRQRTVGKTRRVAFVAGFS